VKVVTSSLSGRYRSSVMGIAVETDSQNHSGRSAHGRNVLLN
jgi:hypothetical protein